MEIDRIYYRCKSLEEILPREVHTCAPTARVRALLNAPKRGSFKLECCLRQDDKLYDLELGGELNNAN